MYKSKNEIEKKLRQVKFVYKEISKFKNRIFLKSGLDEETESYPLLTHLGSFLAHARSVFQYAQKGAKELSSQSIYDNYVSQNKLIKFFKTIRNSEIHEYTIRSHMTISGESPFFSFNSKTHTATGKEIELYVEPLSDLNSLNHKNKDTEIKIDNSFIQKLDAERKKDLAEAARKGEDLYEEQECEGEKDIFNLCEKYIKEIELFIKFGIKSGFIT